MSSFEKNQTSEHVSQEGSQVGVWENCDHTLYNFEGEPLERPPSRGASSQPSVSHETTLERKKRRRVRRRRRIGAAAAAGMIVGILLPIGPIGAIAFAAGGGVAARVISKRREYKKDQRMAEQNNGVNGAPSTEQSDALSPATVE